MRKVRESFPNHFELFIYFHVPLYCCNQVIFYVGFSQKIGFFLL